MTKIERGIFGVIIFLAVTTTIFAIVFISSVADAQTPHPDVPLSLQNGTVSLTCVPTAPMAHVIEVCFLRTDMDPDVDLGCVPALGGTPGEKDLTIVITDDQDAEIRCFSVGSNNMNSEISDNAGTVNFTRPGKPHVVLNTPTAGIPAREQIAQYKHLELSIEDRQ